MKIEDRELLLRYLMGEMSPQESAQIDERLLKEEDFADTFEEIRADLLDAYVAGELGPNLRQRVEASFGMRGAADVAFAAALRKGLERLPTERQAGFLRRLGRKWRFALAVCSIVAAALIVSSIVPRFRQQATPQPEQVASSRITPGSSVAGNTGAIPSREFVLLLNPQVLRGGEAAVQKVSVPENATSVKVQILVPYATEPYSVRITSAFGEKVAFFTKLLPQQLDNNSFVEFSLPRAALPAELYRFSVFEDRAGTGHVYQVQILRDRQPPATR